VLPAQVSAAIATDVLDRFLRYVQIYTTSDERSSTIPSTPRQLDLLRLLADEARALGLETRLDEARGFTLATLPARPGVTAEPFALYAHVDTSPEQPGEGVRPICHIDWDGGPIRFEDDDELTLDRSDSPELADLLGETIITSSGGTLLGADDKAGVAEILAALAALRQSDDLPHGEIVACFTTDEEIGRGTEGLDLSLLPRYGYTMDGGTAGELEDECFDAWRVDVAVTGVGVHPGTAKGRMVHAGMILARLLSALPEKDVPEHTEDREGFTYLSESRGTVEHASATLIVRDFEADANQARIARIREIAGEVEARFPGCRIELSTSEQYRNMRDILREHPHVIEWAEGAIRDAGLEPIRHPIRGGTDGSLLTQAGHPTPNIFAGGMLAHSRKEWIAHRSLCQATETIIHLARRWAEVN
jgi:tripeptide aminopeptidase